MKLFGWGANSYGQLGLGYKCEQIISPEEIIFDKEFENIQIMSIKGGAGHSLVLDEEGFLYSCGWNSKGQLGKELETLKFTKIDDLSEYKIVQISCGWDFSAAITDKGNIFVWGSNSFRQLGLPMSIKYISKPTVLENIKAKYVSCGVRHMAIITTEKKLLICGNGSKGQLGILDENKKIIRESGMIVVPDLNDIKAVSCGQNHTLALKFDDTIYCWGNNKFGQLGFDPNIQENIKTPLKLNLHFPIERIFTGWTHSAVITKNNEIYTFGRNTYGQLGSERINNWVPTLASNKFIKHLSLGSEHNLAIDLEGKLICWGWNEHGNCGTGNTEDVKIPKEIMINYKFIYTSCGTGQSFAVAKC